MDVLTSFPGDIRHVEGGTDTTQKSRNLSSNQGQAQGSWGGGVQEADKAYEPRLTC